MSDELKAIYAAERDAIIAVRKRHPMMGPYALARFIKDEYRDGNSDYVVAGRRPRGPALPEFVESYRRRTGIGTSDT